MAGVDTEWVSGLSLMDWMRKLVIQELFRGELLLLHTERSHLSWFRHLTGTLPGCFLDVGMWANWEETL